MTNSPEYMRKWMSDHPGKATEYSRTYRRKHPEVEQAWITKNRDKVLGYKRKWRENNREKERESCKNWRLNNRDKLAAKSARRRALQLKVSLGNKSEIDLIYARAKTLRQWFDVSVDHIIALDNGGLHSPENLQIIYQFENQKKSNRSDYIPRVIFR